MKIVDVELRRIGLPLVSPFRTSFGTETARDILLVQVTTADRRVLDAEVGGPVLIRINGFEAVAGEVLFLPQAIDEDGFEVLIGYIPLEQAGLAVDMLGHRLVKLPYVDLKAAAAA